ncbi:MAG: VWA domain-containing protein, partial [Thermofilaceae archaeon]
MLRFENIYFLFAAVPLMFTFVFYLHFYLYRRITARFFRLENPMLKVVKQLNKRGKRTPTLILKLLLSATLCMGLASPYLEVEKLQIKEVEAEVRETLKVTGPAVVIATDVSGSMSDTITGGVKISVAKSAILRFLEGIPANISVGLIAFDDKIRLTVPVVRDVEQVKNAVMELEPGGGTMYAYPLSVALNMLKPYRA